MEDMLECLRLADIIKPAKAAADEVLKVMGRGSRCVSPYMSVIMNTPSLMICIQVVAMALKFHF